MLRKMHLLTGALGLLVFVLQGQYMDLFHEHLRNMADAPRMLYRSSHVYFLLASVLNVTMGVYLTDSTPGIHPWVQRIVSSIVLLSPVGLLAGFFLEPGLEDSLRPYTRPVLYGLFGVGVLLSSLGIASRWRR